MEKGREQAAELSQGQVQRLDLRLFSVLAEPEEDFLRQVAELEADPLFVRLREPGPGGRAAVTRRRLPGASYAFFGACADDALAAAVGAAGAGEWLADRPAMLGLARRAGLRNFERFFLSDSPFDAAAAARACGFSPAEAASLKAFADAFVIAHERVPPASLPSLYLRCSAELRASEGGIEISYPHPAYLRGEYRIDRRELARLVRTGALSHAEAARAQVLLSKAQRLSWRKSGLHRLLTALVNAQGGYLLGTSGLKPLTQRELASRAGLSPSTVSRLLSARTVRSPQGEELKLDSLFLAKNKYIIMKMREILGACNGKFTDSELTEVLRKNYGLRVSRRSVNLYRARL